MTADELHDVACRVRDGSNYPGDWRVIEAASELLPTPAEIRARLEKITPGEWFTGPHYMTDIESKYGRVAETAPMRSPQAISNAEFIAHAPADLAFLLAENDRLRAALESIARGDCSCGFTHCDGGCFVGRAAVALETPGAGTGK